MMMGYDEDSYGQNEEYEEGDRTYSADDRDHRKREL